MSEEIIKRNTKEYKHLYSSAINRLKEGMSKEQIFIILSEESKIKDDIYLSTIISDARRFLNDEYVKEKEFTVREHIERYNKEINLLSNIDVSDYNKFKAKEMKSYAFYNLLEVLHQKEKVLGLHTKSVQVKINNKYNAKVIDRKRMYDVSKLTLEEKKEFYKLILKTKKSENELAALSEGTVEKDIIDVEYQMVDSTTNLEPLEEKVKSITKESTQSQEKLEENGSNLLSIQEKMKLTLLKQAQEKFKEAKQKK